MGIPQKQGLNKHPSVLICGSTQGEYGGIEAVMFALADYLYKTAIPCSLVFKLVKGASVRSSLNEAIAATSVSCEVVSRLDRRLIRLLDQADIIHTQNVPPDIVFLAKVLGKPVLSITHNYLHPSFSARKLLWRLGSLVCDYVSYNSRFVQETWIEGVMTNSRSRVIPTLSTLPSLRTPGGRRKGFVFISRWIPNKGADLLIESYARAQIDRREWPLIMMGDGPERSRLEQIVSERGIEGISILGRVSEKEKFERMHEAKWIVVPPHTHEDMGLTPIEGRVMGTPAIASLDGGIPESAGEDALFFPPGDQAALTKCIETAAEMSENAYLDRASRCQTSLKSYLKPMSVYLQWYEAAYGKSVNQPAASSI